MMLHAIGFHVSEGMSRLRGRVVAFFDRTDERLCAREDERARGRGWTVIRTEFGARRYRDPRFDLLKARAELAAAGERAGG
jgi:hypothetical protein